MEDSAFTQVLRIPLKHSRFMLSVLLIVHLLLFITLLLFDLGINKWPFCFLLLLSAVYHSFRYHRQYFPYDSKEFLLNQEDEFCLITGSNDCLKTEIVSPNFVHPFLMVLRLRYEKRIITLVFLKDNIHVDSFRRLRVRLRFPKQQKLAAKINGI